MNQFSLRIGDENKHSLIGGSEVNSGRIVALEGLRGCAILAVLLYHLRPTMLGGGFIGVTIFFVLSGFFITRSVIREFASEKKFSYLRYLLRHVLRLWLPMVVTIAFSAVLVYLFSPSLLAKVQSDAISATFFVSNWVYIFREVPYFAAAGLPSPLTHLWYLGVLAQFYLLWPLILMIIRKIKCSPRLVIGILAGVSVIFMAVFYFVTGDVTRSYYGLDTRFAELMLGALVAVLYQDFGLKYREVIEKCDSRKTFYQYQLGALGAFFILILLAVRADGESAWAYCGGFFFIAVVTAVIVLGTSVPNIWLNRILANPILKYLGSHSFSLYLMHYPILLVLNPATRTVEIGIWEQLLQIVIVGVASEIFYQLVEWPSGYFAAKIGKKENFANGMRVANSRIRRNLLAICGVLSVFSVFSLCGLMFAPIDWQGVAWARATALRPELEQKNNASASGKEKSATEKKDKSSKANGEAKVGGTLKPSAKKIPNNLDSAGWKTDPSTGICSANALIIGDSVTHGATAKLHEILPNSVVDGKVSRQLRAGVDVYLAHQKAGVKFGAVVYALGTNGLIRDESQVQRLIDVAEGAPVYFVTTRNPYPMQNTNNAILNKYAAKHPNVGIIDWWAETEGHSEYLVDDGIHTTNLGAQKFARLIQKALCG